MIHLLAEKLIELRRNTELMKELVENGIRLGADRFSGKSQVKIFENAVYNALGNDLKYEKNT